MEAKRFTGIECQYHSGSRFYAGATALSLGFAEEDVTPDGHVFGGVLQSHKYDDLFGSNDILGYRAVIFWKDAFRVCSCMEDMSDGTIFQTWEEVEENLLYLVD